MEHKAKMFICIENYKHIEPQQCYNNLSDNIRHYKATYLDLKYTLYITFTILKLYIYQLDCCLGGLQCALGLNRKHWVSPIKHIGKYNKIQSNAMKAISTH